MEAKIRWGIVGPGNIATKFVENLKLFDEVEISGVASRSWDKAKEFSAKHSIENAFGSYKELFSSNIVDIVYIATPHRFHKALAMEAMDAGKHVLCEKPLGVNRKEVKELTACAKRNKVFLMEGLWSRFNPSIKAIKKMIEEGKIGEITHLHADFAFYAMDRGMESRLLDPDLAGGSLLDIGIYPIFLAYLLLGLPNDIHSVSSFLENGTELQTSVIFSYPKAQALLYSGFTSNSEIRAEIFGAKGQIIIHPRWHEARGFSLNNEDGPQNYEMPLKGNGLYHEIEEAHHCLRSGLLESPLWTHQNSLDLAELLDTVRAKSGIRFPFE